MATNDSRLRSLLDCLAPGPIPDATEVERSLVACWDDFAGHDESGMAAHKLISRMETVIWQPPILTFTIERHGGTVLGSTRAELHCWTVDLDAMTALCTVVGQRTVGPTAKPVRENELQLIAQEIVELVRIGVIDHRLVWKDSDTVHIVIEQITPSTGFARTIQGRRKRLRQLLEELLEKGGWSHVGRNVFKRSANKNDDRRTYLSS
jgi:hypothetical protein